MNKYIYDCKILTYDDAMEACKNAHPEFDLERLIKYFNDYVIVVNGNESWLRIPTI